MPRAVRWCRTSSGSRAAYKWPGTPRSHTASCRSDSPCRRLLRHQAADHLPSERREAPDGLPPEAATRHTHLETSPVPGVGSGVDALEPCPDPLLAGARRRPQGRAAGGAVGNLGETRRGPLVLDRRGLDALSPAPAASAACTSEMADPHIRSRLVARAYTWLTSGVSQPRSAGP